MVVVLVVVVVVVVSERTNLHTRLCPPLHCHPPPCLSVVVVQAGGKRESMLHPCFFLLTLLTLQQLKSFVIKHKKKYNARGTKGERERERENGCCVVVVSCCCLLLSCCCLVLLLFSFVFFMATLFLNLFIFCSFSLFLSLTFLSLLSLSSLFSLSPQNTKHIFSLQRGPFVSSSWTKSIEILRHAQEGGGLIISTVRNFSLL